MQIDYGKVTTEVAIDDEGSINNIEQTVVNGQLKSIFDHYEVRVRVTSFEQEIEEYIEFRKFTAELPNCQFKIEHTATAQKQGFYYVVKCFTVKRESV